MRAVLATVAILAAVSAAALSVAVACSGTPNLQPIYDGQGALVQTVTNGKKYVNTNVSPALHTVHVYGTPYQMGYAYGQLMKKEIGLLLPQAFAYMDGRVAEVLKFLPASWASAIAQWGVQFALNITYDLTKPYISNNYIQEVQGVADATGIPFYQVMNIALFPELIKASCSMVGAWDNATIHSRGGALVQLRALDWTTDGPFQQFPIVLVYHPEATNGNAFAVVTWAGLVGAISGYSASEVGICEKVWIHYTGNSSRSGIPFTFLLRDILQYDTSVEDAVSRIENAHRTCSIFIGVGDAKENTFRGIEYSLDEVNVYDDKNFPAYPNHDLRDGLVFFDKHTQPSSDPCLNDLLGQYYGYIDPVITLRNITSVFQTGDMHIAIYDFAESSMYVSNAGLFNATSNYAQPAYDRSFIRLNMTELFSETA